MGLSRQSGWSNWNSGITMAGRHTQHERWRGRSDDGPDRAQQDRARSGLGGSPWHLCNVLVCLAIWLCMGAWTVTDKNLAIVFPIPAFVACGFEHSVAIMYVLPIGVALAAGISAPLSVTNAVGNLALVTICNVLVGTVLVALIYWLVYLRNSE
jgi:hypothetical protein